MKRFVLAAFISIVIHALVIFILTGAEITPPAPGAGSGVTRATFVTLNTGPAEDARAEEGNQEAAPAEKPIERKEKIINNPPETPEPVTKPVPPEKPEPVEKKEKAPVKKTTAKPKKKEAEIEKADKREDKISPVETEQAIAEQPGESSSEAKGSQDNSSDSSSGEVNPNPGTEAVSKNINRIHDIAEGDITRRVTPGYPRASRLRREEGQVVIVAEIKNGKTVKVSIESSSGHQRLDRSAIEAVKKWEFGFTEERTVRIPVIFRLRN